MILFGSNGDAMSASVLISLVLGGRNYPDLKFDLKYIILILPKFKKIFNIWRHLSFIFSEEIIDLALRVISGTVLLLSPLRHLKVDTDFWVR